MWNYAELSKLAKENGGPENLVEILINSGRKDVIPWVGVAFTVGVAATISVQKAIKYLLMKNKKSATELETAKQELIRGIKEYDALQSNSAVQVIEEQSAMEGEGYGTI